MIKRILHILLWILISIILLFVFIIVTPTGLRLSVVATTKIIPGVLKIKEVNGSLIKDLEITDLQYKNQFFSVNISKVQFKWLPIALLSKRLDITKMHINDIDIKYTTTTASRKKPIAQAKPEAFDIKKFAVKLPIQLTLADVSINNLTIQQDKQPKTTIRSLNLSAKTSGDQLIIKKIATDTDPYKIEASGNIQLEFPFKTDIQTQTITELPGSYPIHTYFNITGDLDKAISFTAEIKQPFTALIKGTLQQPLQAGPINITGEWKNLILPFDIAENVTSEHGNLQVTGNLSNYQLDLTTDLAGANIPAGHWIIKGLGNLTQIQLNQINAKTLHGEITGNIHANWQRGLTWQSTISMRNIDPGIKWPNWQGNLNAHINSTGNITQKESRIEVNLQQLSGSLNGHAISGYFSMLLHNKELTIPACSLRIGSDYLNISGNLIQHWNFRWKISAPNITEVIPNATGTVYSQGTLTGNSKMPAIKGTLSIKDLIIDPFRIKQITGQINLQLDTSQNSSVNLQGEKLHYVDYHLNEFNFKLSGPLENHYTQINLHTDHANLHSVIKIQQQQKIFKIILHQLDLYSLPFGNWHLKQPLTITTAENSINVTPFIWQSNTGLISGQFNRDETLAWQGQLQAQNIPTLIFSVFLPASLMLDTHLNANVNLTSDAEGKIQGTANINATKGQIIYSNKIRHTVLFTNSQLNFNFDKQGLSSLFTVKTQQQTPIDVALNLPNYYGQNIPEVTHPINGHVKIKFDDLEFLSAFIPQVNVIKGILQSDLKIDGTIKKPTLVGTIALKNGAAKIEQYGTSLNDINFTLTGHYDGKINLAGYLYSGGNKLSLEGNTSINESSLPSTYDIKGKNIEVMNTNEYKIAISPNLKITYNKPKLIISGDIDIPRATLTPKDFTSTVTLPSNTIIIKGSENLNEPSLIDVYSKIKVILGKDIYFTYAGINAHIGGELTVESSPKQLTTGNGEINILDGKFDAYGTKLSIDKGAIIYTGGPIDDPNLDLQATKTVKHYVTAGGSAGLGEIPNVSAGLQDVIVGVRITGSAKRPILKLFSEPPGISESDILSYLVLGVPTNQASGAQAQLLMKAAQSTSTVGNLTNDIKNTFGLSEVGLQSDTVEDTDNKPKQNTSFVIGKYLTPKLYMSYSVGILVPINVLMVRYILSHHWSVQTESSSIENGGDIFYTIQTD